VQEIEKEEEGERSNKKRKRSKKRLQSVGFEPTPPKRIAP
jgi:hypothetical protein